MRNTPRRTRSERAAAPRTARPAAAGLCTQEELVAASRIPPVARIQARLRRYKQAAACRRRPTRAAMTAAFLAFSHAALVAAYHSGLGGAMRTTNARRAVSPVSDLSILGARDAVNGCVLLPHTPFEGACPPLIFGEMNLQVTCGMPLLLAPPHSLNRSALFHHLPHHHLYIRSSRTTKSAGRRSSSTRTARCRTVPPRARRRWTRAACGSAGRSSSR